MPYKYQPQITFFSITCREIKFSTTATHVFQKSYQSYNLVNPFAQILTSLQFHRSYPLLIISFLNKPIRKLKIVQTPTLDQDIQHVPTNDSSQHKASKYRKYCVLGLHRCNYLNTYCFRQMKVLLKVESFFFTLYLTENEFKLSFDKLNCTFLKF